MAKTKLTTPIGIAKFPHIAKPDNYKGAEHYKVTLVLSKEEALAFRKKVEEFAKSNKTVTASKPKISIKPELDKEENQTGNYVLTAKSKYQPLVKDAKNQKLAEVPRIGGGSKLRLMVELFPYDEGVSLRLVAVQVIELHSYGEGDYDFDVEDGYEGDTSEDDADFEGSSETEDALEI